ncbi:hypothetical protein ACIHFC_28940 [Streptomyces sp. NPDC052013]|uniref:hypothetical protein n=1 Tax=Streptomyces sp. NPDC052013 TaxID=3365679 RepID=UPI0037D46215
MTYTVTKTVEEQTKAELLAAIRKQTEAASNQIPRVAAATLRDLAEAYAVLTVEPLPLFPLQPPADDAH